MGNKNYLSGRRKEYKIQNSLRDNGYIALRTAGSHGFADIIAIDRENKKIKFIQCKPKKFSYNNIQKLNEENKWCSGLFEIEFIVV